MKLEQPKQREESAVCRKWPSGTDEAGQKRRKEMKYKKRKPLPWQAFSGIPN